MRDRRGLPAIRYPGRVQAVRFLERPNRFLARVRPLAGGAAFYAHITNPGRMEELLIPGETRGLVVAAPGDRRRTQHTLVSVRHGRVAVSIDASIGNRLVAAALARGVLGGLPRTGWRAETVWGDSRFDFARPASDRRPPRFLLEVKCSNLRVGRTALFPDAPTARGARHLQGLARAARHGIRGGVVFVIQRDDVDEFRPNGALDPRFTAALAEARDAGVRAWAVTTRIGRTTVRWGRRVPVRAAQHNPFSRAPP